MNHHQTFMIKCVFIKRNTLLKANNFAVLTQIHYNFFNMAESSDRGSSSSESGTTISLLCDPCDEEGKRKTAVGYCVDCKEYLCDTCYSHHCSPRPSRNHVLQDSSQMPKLKAISQSLRMKCSTHPEEEIAFFCESHTQLCCTLCIKFSHAFCKEVGNIHESSSNLTQRNEFLEFTRRLQTFYEKYDKIRINAERNIELTNTAFADTMETLKSKLEEIRSNHIGQMSFVLKTCDPVLNQIKRWQSEIEKLKDEEEYKLFVFMKITKSHFGKLDDNMIQLHRMKDEICFHTFTGQVPGSEEVIYKVTKTPFHLFEISLRHSTESKTCSIQDMLFVEKGLLLVTDGNNYSIKLVDTKRDEVLAKLYTELDTYIYAEEEQQQQQQPQQQQIAFTSKKEAFVTFNSEIFRLTCPTENVNKYETITLQGHCGPIEYYDHKLRIQCIGPCKLLEYNEDGNFIRTINEDISKASKEIQPNTICPKYSSLNKETGAMILSCPESNFIFETSMEGTVKLIVKSEQLKGPKGLEWLPDGSILVCSGGGKKIIRVNDNDYIEDFIKEELPFEPTTMCIDHENRLLYVAGVNDKAFVYQMPCHI